MMRKKIDLEDKHTDDRGPLTEINPVDSDGEEKIIIDSTEELQKKLESKEQEVKEIYDRLLRVSAEFENYKKRAKRETDDFKKFANESLIAALLPVVDNLQRAVVLFKENGSHTEPSAEGVSLTLSEILKVLEKFNVTGIDALGQPFDPNFHEAMMQESSDDHPDNTVIKELQKGYRIHGRLLRPSLVVVSKKKQEVRHPNNRLKI